MRAYFFCNFYLSSIQQGIQSAHCLHELFVKYPINHDEASALLWEWATSHKTMIVLNGGNSADLNNMVVSLEKLANEAQIPFTSFSEDEQSLNRAITCVGMVLPERLYEAAALVRKPETVVITRHAGSNRHNVIVVPTNGETRLLSVGEGVFTFAEFALIQAVNAASLAH